VARKQKGGAEADTEDMNEPVDLKESFWPISFEANSPCQWVRSAK
jgi:hypothetical protein